MEDGAEADDITVDIWKIERNAHHLLGLINDVLDLSNVESGKMDVYPETLAIAEIVRDVVSTARALTATVGGALTGRGGSVVIIDDPLKASEAQSEATRGGVNRWFDETLLSRLDDKRNDAIVPVMQRLHVDDLAGRILKAGEWTCLDLPAIADANSSVPTGEGRVHHRRIGEVLHPEREPQQVLDDQRRSMGTAASSTLRIVSPTLAFVKPNCVMIKDDVLSSFTTRCSGKTTSSVVTGLPDRTCDPRQA